MELLLERDAQRVLSFVVLTSRERSDIRDRMRQRTEGGEFPFRHSLQHQLRLVLVNSTERGEFVDSCADRVDHHLGTTGTFWPFGITFAAVDLAGDRAGESVLAEQRPLHEFHDRHAYLLGCFASLGGEFVTQPRDA